VIELSTHPCTPREQLELRRRAESLQRQIEGRVFYRRVWVFFAITMLARGIWDAYFSQFHPVWGPVVIVGGAISAMTLTLMFLRERNDQQQSEFAEKLLKDAQSGEYQQVRITGIHAVAPLVDLASPKSRFRLTTDRESIDLGDASLVDAVEEYQFSLRGSVEQIDTWFSSEVLLTLWPQANLVRSLELSGPPVPVGNPVALHEVSVSEECIWKTVPEID